MDEYADIYYVDTRNADARDHRTHGSGPANWRPSAGPANSPSRTVIVNPAPASGYAATPYVRPMAYQAPYPAGYAYPAQAYPGQSPLAGLFGSMPVGQILEMVAMAFAALAPLPSAPTATRDTMTDVGNLILYQGALAQHAKRDEQVRTIGNLVAKLVA